MMQVIQMTDKEKLKMYMKCNKKELAKMLVVYQFEFFNTLILKGNL